VFLRLEKLESKLFSMRDTRIGAVDGSPIGIDPTCKFRTEINLKNVFKVLRAREVKIKVVVDVRHSNRCRRLIADRNRPDLQILNGKYKKK
jgi:hypothetical protein